MFPSSSQLQEGELWEGGTEVALTIYRMPGIQVSLGLQGATLTCLPDAQESKFCHSGCSAQTQGSAGDLR